MYWTMLVLVLVTNSVAFAWQGSSQGTRRYWPVEPPVPAQVPPNLCFEGLDQYPDYLFYLSYSNTKGTISFPAEVEFKGIGSSIAFTVNPRFNVEEYRIWAFPKSEIDRLGLRTAFMGDFDKIKGGVSVVFSPPENIKIESGKPLPNDIAKVYRYSINVSENRVTVTPIGKTKSASSNSPEETKLHLSVWILSGGVIGLFLVGIVIGRFFKN